MSKFTAMARIISHLGDQLISSSTVALLELIKNAYDAGSPSVTIKIDQSKRTMVIEDKGHGMTESEIKEKYLVVGTTSRLKEKNKIKNEENINTVKTPMGEKGLGRFATMKLGERLVLLTKTKLETCILGINWNQFGYESEKTLDEVNVHLFKENYQNLNINQSNEKENETFTKIKIYGLKDFCEEEYWPKKQFEKYYKDNFSKFINPFKPNKGFQVKLEVTTCSGEFFRLTPDIMNRKVLKQAPYRFKGKIENSKLYYTYYIRGEDLKEYRSKSEEVYEIEELDSISSKEDFGPIEFEFYFFNRTTKRLKEIKGIEEISKVRKFIDQYNGGIMIYRDNFRVLPYAEPGNDWLELDKGSFRAKGIRFNTIQTIGAIHIKTLENENLIDQTNREGLVHNKAYFNLCEALKQAMITFKNKINNYYSDKKKIGRDDKKSFESIAPFQKNIDDLKTNLHSLVVENSNKSFTFNKKINVLEKNFDLVQRGFITFKEEVHGFEKRLKEIEDQQRMVLELAGIGMTAETVAHEMRSYLDRMMGLLKIIGKKDPKLKNDINILLQNTRSLEAVVSRLNIQTVTKRRTKSRINLVKLIEEICDSKMKIWEMEGKKNIDIKIKYEDDYFIKANEGMLIQVFDNLLNNSRYWLLKRVKKDPSIKPLVKINISKHGIITYYDNGLGIQEVDSQHIFEPFFSRRKEGRGLGLYITQSILSFHNSDIVLNTSEKNELGNYYKFELDFSASSDEG